MLTANQKYIDTANIKHLLSAGEKNADKIQIAIDRYYHQTDLSDCLFTLRAVNSGGGLVMQNLEKETTENQIILTWAITEDFTAVPGELLPEIVGQKDDTVVIKYEMTPMVVRNSILEQYKGGIDAIDKALRDMQSILAQAEQLIAKMPIIKNGTWWIYDATTGNYQDSGQSAKGDNGTPGKDGINGKDGKNGADGYSPTATVTETDAGATITITDKNGTTTATVKNGENAEATLWGDFTPGWDGQATLSYCKAKLVTVMGKQTWQVLPSISTASHNALNIVPDGLFVLDLSPDVAELKASAHMHDNKEALDSITSDEITTWDGYSEEIQTIKDGLVGKKDTNSPNSTGEVFNYYTSNKATGDYSHSEGMGTTASGTYSHAEGNGTIASGGCSHAEGSNTKASGIHSHAEGDGAIASGVCSHAEGNGTIASGYYSHAEGGATKVSGHSSHAEGFYTIASGSYQHVQGKFNVEDSDSKYAFIVGNGADDNNRSNAFAIDWNGKIYVNNATEGVDVSALTTTIAKLQSQLSRKTIQFRHGKGMFTATATGTNVSWQYGGQQVQGGSCTFDVKSDNGLITLECDTIESLTIKNDTTNKMDLSDLGGKIASVLSLESCPNITGDLSDLGGKIASSLNLSSCPNITGDLSDLGGKIANWLSLDNCPNITGDLSDLGGKITNWLSLKGCRNITGDLSDLGSKIASMLNLGYCSNITGVYSGTKYPKTFAVSKTAITSANMDANLINFAASGVKSGTFTATGMKRTAASDNAVATLVTNGWTVSGLTKEG